MWKHHGLPTTIISDRGPQFASRFWKALCERLGIEVRLSTAFHPQTDRQTERFNTTMEEYLRVYVNHHQDDWVTWLPFCEFAANYAVSETTGVSPFCAHMGRDPRMNFDLDKPIENPEEARAHEAAQTLERIHDLVRTEMAAAQYRQAEGYDRHRRPAPRYLPGDEVWLDARHIKTTRPARKLDWKKLGPYRVLKEIGPMLTNSTSLLTSASTESSRSPYSHLWTKTLTLGNASHVNLEVYPNTCDHSLGLDDCLRRSSAK